MMLSLLVVPDVSVAVSVTIGIAFTVIVPLTEGFAHGPVVVTV